MYIDVLNTHLAVWCGQVYTAKKTGPRTVQLQAVVVKQSPTNPLNCTVKLSGKGRVICPRNLCGLQIYPKGCIPII